MLRNVLWLAAGAGLAWIGHAQGQLPATAAYLGSTEAPSVNRAASEPAAMPVKGHERREFLQADDGLFYVEALVNGTPIRFVVDTGATMVVLNADDAAAVAQGSRAKSSIDVQTVGGTRAMQRVTLREVSVAGRTVSNIDAAVMPDHLPVSLLGQNVLSQLDSVTMKGSRLELN